MASKPKLQCPHCGRDNFKGEKGLNAHLRTNARCNADHIAAKRELQNLKRKPAVAFEELGQNDLTNMDTTKEEVEDTNDQMASDDETDEEIDDDNVMTWSSDEDDDEEEEENEEDGHDEEGNGGTDDNGVPQQPSKHHVEQFRQYVDYVTENTRPFDHNERAAIQLLSTLAKKKAPLDTCDDVMHWHLDNSSNYDKDGEFTQRKFISRKKMMAKLAKRHNVPPEMVRQKEIVLPRSKA